MSPLPLVLSLLASTAMVDAFAQTFSFVEPGGTTPEVATRVHGEPYLDYEVEVLEGDLDVLIGPDSDDDVDVRAKAQGRVIAVARVLEWRSEKRFGEVARLVFRQERLWYALVPVIPAEATEEAIVRRYGSPKIRVERRRVADVVYSVRLLEYPELGIGFVQKTGGAVTAKVLFSKNKQ